MVIMKPIMVIVSLVHLDVQAAITLLFALNAPQDIMLKQLMAPSQDLVATAQKNAKPVMAIKILAQAVRQALT